ncbi:MAG: polysaccharide biosynthesis tyrosine autokinase [Anaerolineae bacterium]
MELGQYLKRVFRWWWLFILSTGLAAAVSYYASMEQPSIYQTTTTLLVGQVTQKANPTGQDFYTIERLAESYAQMAIRQPILQGAIDNLGIKMSWQSLKSRVNAYPIARTQLLGITVQDRSPERAVAITDEIARQLILQSPTSPQNEQRAERSEFVQSQLVALERRIQRAEEKLQELETELDSALSARQIQDIQAEKASLEALISNWQANYADLFTFLEGGDSPNYLSIIEPAQLPTRPISPKVEVNVLLAAATGFMLALAAALVLEYLDDTLKTTDDLTASLGLASLGAISKIKGKAYKDKMVIAHTPFSPVAEAYRLVRTNIQFMAVDRPAKTIMVTSPNLGEGKSTTAANLGVVMAQADLRTIIVDTDLRRPAIHKIFQVPNSGGLTDLLRSPELDVGDQLKSTEFENLQVITSGPLPPNSSEMLGSQRMAHIFKQLEAIADVVIFDSPPVLMVTDATVLSNRVDGVVLVVQAKRTRREAARQAVQRLKQVGANILGCVLNEPAGKGGGTYYNYYVRSSAAGQMRYAGQRHWWQRWSASR